MNYETSRVCLLSRFEASLSFKFRVEVSASKTDALLTSDLYNSLLLCSFSFKFSFSFGFSLYFGSNLSLSGNININVDKSSSYNNDRDGRNF